ncbi:hypothetical protein PIROE2DRAFT_3529 [Piromyces sp. E2]|nr:hypothetical protein PIROE2DRAFT_3529 [Piromyces sp. E2]|eukprot:OUM68687.1 hypothetical protein PIROE2DRAFT_3529 [Piromyces sp. E2]
MNIDNYIIDDINTILKEELNNCIYCCCSKTQNKSENILSKKIFKLEYIHCSSFYEVLHNQLEDIIIKLYIELITEEKTKYSNVYSIYDTLNLDSESQRKLYINNFDSQSFITFLLNYSSVTNSNQTIYQKILSYIKINKNYFLSYLNSIFDIDSIDNFLTIFNINITPQKKMSGKQYTSEYAVQVTKDVDAKELAEQLGLCFGGQIGELEGYYLFKVDNSDVNDENVFKNIESKLSKEKNIEWYERQYLKKIQ